MLIIFFWPEVAEPTFDAAFLEFEPSSLPEKSLFLLLFFFVPGFEAEAGRSYAAAPEMELLCPMRDFFFLPALLL